MKLNNHMIAKNHDIMQDLIKIVDMYLDVEEKHYQEMIDNDETIHFHIFQSFRMWEWFSIHSHSQYQMIVVHLYSTLPT